MTTEAPPVQTTGPAVSGPDPSPYRYPRSLFAVGALWRREVLRLLRSKAQIAMGLVTPLMFLTVLGTGLESMGGEEFRDFRAFLFPGMVLMATQSPALVVGLSVVLDRQTGLLRQALVAPVRRGALLVGLCLGGSTCGAVYGTLVVLAAPVAGVDYHPMLLVTVFESALVGLLFTAGGLLAAVTLTRIQTFQLVISLALMPMLFLSGAVFSPRGLPGWMGIAVHLNPLTYAVDALRRTMPGNLDLLGGSVTPQPFGWTPPVALELAFVAALALTLLALAARRFARTE